MTFFNSFSSKTNDANTLNILTMDKEHESVCPHALLWDLARSLSGLLHEYLTRRVLT